VHRLISLLLFSSSLLANTSVVGVDVTNTQAIVHVTTDQAGTCTYRISESNTLSPLVHDVAPALYAGANSDSRAGSIIRGNDHWFVAGSRVAALAADGVSYSRALQALTQHYGGVTCGSDAEVPFTFTTNNIFTGNTFSDPLPFDAAQLGNYALPTFDYKNKVVDTETGMPVYPVTGPAQYTMGAQTLKASLGSTYSPGAVEGADLQKSNWTCTGAVDACTYTAAAQDVLMVRLAATKGPGAEGGNFNWQNTLGALSNFHDTGIDTLQVSVSGNGGGATIPLDVALTWNGVDQATEWKQVTLPASAGTVKYPSALTGLLAAWQGPNYPLVPGMMHQLTQEPLTVNTSGITVTSPTDGIYFSLDPRILKAGSKITIAGMEYTVASVDSATQITLTESAGTQTGAQAYISNFGVMVRKHSASAGTVRLSSLTVTLANSLTFNNGGSGFQQNCSPLTSTDSTGHVGRFCLFQSLQPAIYWVTNDFQSRFIGRAYAPASSIGVPADEYSGMFYGGQSIFDGTVANSWYLSPTLTASGRSTLVKATYNPSGGNCTNGSGIGGIPGDYGAFPLQSATWTNALDNCHITYTEVTRPSLGKGLYTQLSPSLKNGKWQDPGFSFVLGTTAVFQASTGGGNIEARFVHVDVKTGTVTGEYSTYMNPPGGCRFCGVHAPLPSNSTDSWYGLIYHDVGESQATGGTTTGDGPYTLPVGTALTTTPKLACAGNVDSSVAWLIPYSAGCDEITLTAADSIPCDPDPSTWESAHMPACTWRGGTQFEGGVLGVGDHLWDATTGYERLVVAKHVGGAVWNVLRNVDIPHGPRLNERVGASYIKAHSSNWTATLLCNFPGNAFVSTAEVNGSGLIWDQKFMGFNHAALRHDGISSAEIFYDVFGAPSGISVRLGPYPGATGQRETHRLLANPTFAGKQGVASGSFVQSHLGWREGDTFITDFAPFAPAGGGAFVLWRQPNTHVSGSLYKLAAADAYSPMDKRRRAQAVWSGMYNMKDVSGAGINGASGHNWHYCSIDYPGATCGQAGESVGDVYMNVPTASTDPSYMGRAFDVNNLNSAPLSMEVAAAMQYYLDAELLSSDGMSVNLGRHTRRLTTALGRYNGQDTYSNLKALPGGNVALMTCSALNMQRNSDICMIPVLPKPAVEIGNDFLTVPVAAGPANYAEVQFGYAEYGAPDAFYCTTRQEACNTSSPAGTPFNWEGEARHPAACSTGCSVKVPVLPDHVVYYRTRTSNNGTTWSNGTIQVAAAPGPGGVEVRRPDVFSDLAQQRGRGRERLDFGHGDGSNVRVDSFLQ
jgi:hypothetical protein